MDAVVRTGFDEVALDHARLLFDHAAPVAAVGRRGAGRGDGQSGEARRVALRDRAPLHDPAAPRRLRGSARAREVRRHLRLKWRQLPRHRISRR